MKLRLLAVGTRMPGWVVAATEDYLRRFPRECRLELIEIAAAHRGSDAHRARQEEGRKLLAGVGARDRVIALCVEGRRWSTPELARQLGEWRQTARDVSLLIGGPDGLDSACLQRAEVHWSLSPLTLPHALARVVVIEQLYRAWSLLAGHPYHRD